jgi:signal transduction histidine kinase
VWAALVAVDRGFLVVGLSVFAPYCFDDLRWALAVLLPWAAVWLWQLAAGTGGIEWPEVAVVLLLVAIGVAIVAYMTSLARQNSERQRLIEQLQATRSELAAAERHAGVLAERQRLARDIHDTLTQGFASIVMLLEAAETSLAGGPATRHVAQAMRTARDNLAESRRLVWALRPDALTEARLPDAIGDLLHRLEDETHLQTELVLTGTPRPLGTEAETAMLRVAQEALANVRRHAHASRATVTISYMEDIAVLDVQDDGVGFEPSTAAHHGNGLGLQAMRERAQDLGGHVSVETVPGSGTTLVFQLPLERDRSPSAPATGADS